MGRGLARGGFTTKTRRTRRFFGDRARRLDHEIIEIYERGVGTERLVVGGWWLVADWVGFKIVLVLVLDPRPVASLIGGFVLA